MYKQSLLAVLVTGALSSVAIADQPSDDIETILVTATRFERPAIPIATNITVIDKAEIQLSGALSVTDILRSQAGIQLKELGGVGDRNTQISMRGFGENSSSNVLIMVDGRKLNNPTLSAPTLNSIGLQDIERIELVQGSAGVLYGDQAVAGVINIVTTRATNNDVQGNVEISSGSDNYERYIASVSQSLSSGLSYRLSAENKQTDNYRDNNEDDYENYLLNANYDFDGGSIYFEGQKIIDDLNLPGSLTESIAESDHRHSETPNDYSNQDTEILRFGGKAELSSRWQMAIDYAWRDEDTKVFFDDYDSGLYPTLAHQSTRVKNYSPRIIGELNEDGSALLTLGYDRTNSDYLVSEWFLDADQKIEALYGQIIWPLSERVSINVGGRISKIKERNHETDQDQSDKAEAYEMGLVYQFSEDINIVARYAQAFRYATLDENGFTLSSVDFLKPQTSDSFEFGTEINSENSLTRISLYKLTLDDEIAYDAGVSNPMWWDPNNIGANINLPTSERRGLTVENQYKWSVNLSLRANYTYTDAEQKSGSFKGKDVDFVAKNMASVVMQYDFLSGLSSYIEAVYTGRRYRANDYENSQGELASYTLLNTNLIYRYKNWRANVRVNNLLDKEYSGYSIYSSFKDDNYVYPQAGRNIEVGVNYSF